VPDEDLIADFYSVSCQELAASGIAQYEISNFARGPRAGDGFPAHASRHNLKYWLRRPYMGFGVDAHSMLLSRDAASRHSAVRFATGDELEALLVDAALDVTRIDERSALEETWFLGLRLNRGVELSRVELAFGAAVPPGCGDLLGELASNGLMDIENGWVRLTARGRLLSNEVFSRFLA
jgi:oxygen-independent coproporphyrinogen-3 oxidase